MATTRIVDAFHKLQKDIKTLNDLEEEVEQLKRKQSNEFSLKIKRGKME